MGCFLHLEAIFDALLELDRQVKKTKSVGRHFYVSGNKIRLLARRTTNFTKQAFFHSIGSKTGIKDMNLLISPPSSPRMRVKEDDIPEWRMNYEEFDKQSFKHDDIFDANGELTPAAIAFNQKSAKVMASKRLTTHPLTDHWIYSDSSGDSEETEASIVHRRARKGNTLQESEVPISGLGRNGKKRRVTKLAGAYFEVSDSE